jgi:hypothetical protein
MIIDANLLLYAKIADYPQHPAAHHWLESQFQSSTRVGLPWSSLLAFLRISTNPRLFKQPLSITAAWQQVGDWLNLPTVWIPAPSSRHAVILGQLLQESQATGNLISDAHLAALAMEHDLLLCSADQDFAQFTGLRWFNPLKPL